MIHEGGSGGKEEDDTFLIYSRLVVLNFLRASFLVVLLPPPPRIMFFLFLLALRPGRSALRRDSSRALSAFEHFFLPPAFGTAPSPSPTFPTGTQ